MLFDTHAHLDDAQFATDVKEVIRRAQEEFGVGYIVNVGYNRETILSTMELVEQYDFIYAAVGWHPHEAASCTEEDLDWIRSLTRHPKVVAIGETGLDYYRNHSPKEKQQEVFRQQIRLAREVNLPIIIHNREADPDILHILEEEKAEEVGGMMHCFSGNIERMKQYLAFNFLIGLGGIVTFKNAADVQEVAKQVPLDALVVETDCPYLAPHPFRGKRNETGYVRFVAEKIAELRGMKLEELAEQTTNNAKRLLKIQTMEREGA